MFDVAPTELLLVVVVALVVIGPKDLPKAMRFVGKWLGKARGMARHFRAGLDTMMREAELEELEKQWREQNEAIMREFPRVDDIDAAAAATPTGSTSHPAQSAEADKGKAIGTGEAETHVVPPRGEALP
ncbi:Sec-independent protein translocase protein TatB [Sphingopyxis sp. FD7]|jgi:sec-independent protein translocase protein TatB|uniref:Sec-independent protein translocase protein TatB n=1 Tax=Sphingopyxis sp. FD7 TaxID=1914525 RepID=UPI000DC61C24|nr:Sec-independent protein translocase protein TatB [Sphingopyxis sp. FD7]BBB11787.1 twin-arginine translocation protein TatB [Sphingopyxis sp. FD7]